MTSAVGSGEGPRQPLVSIVTVNYNGAEFLPALLASLEHQTYPDFEVVLVDNASSDGSQALVREHYPWVRLVESRRNLGFTGGNNLGFAAGKGEYFALINNDTVVSPDWLEHLVAEAESVADCGGVNSKILFARPFLEVRLRVDPFTPSEVGFADDDRALGVLFAEDTHFTGCDYRKPIFKQGFYGPEWIDGEAWRWTQGEATVYLPVEPAAESTALRLHVRGAHGRRRLRVALGDEPLGEVVVGTEATEACLPLTRDQVDRLAFDVINNAGSFLHADGSAGDRGIYEIDRAQWDEAAELSAICGCAVLLSRRALDRAGWFDEDLGMYFEDTELSWRLVKQGYRLRYQPRSVVRHFHASTSGEWSPMFNFLVGRNRVLMLFKHASAPRALAAYGEELLRCLRLMLRHRTLTGEPVRTRIRIQLSLVRRLPKMLLKRFGLLTHRAGRAAWRRPRSGTCSRDGRPGDE